MFPNLASICEHFIRKIVVIFQNIEHVENQCSALLEEILF